MFALCGPPQSLEHICGIPLQKYAAHCGIIFALWGPPHSFTGLTRSVHMPPLGDPLAATVNDQGLFDITAFCGWAGGLFTCWESSGLCTKLMGRCVVAGSVDWIVSLWVLRGWRDGVEGYPCGGANNGGIMHNTRITCSENRSVDMGREALHIWTHLPCGRPRPHGNLQLVRELIVFSQYPWTGVKTNSHG